MDIEIKMPDLATADSEVTLLRWLIAVGQTVKLGQPLLEIETDKATMEVESVAAGVLKAAHAEPGDLVPVGQVIAIVTSDAPATMPADLPTAPPQPSIVLPAEPVVQLGAARRETSLFARNRARRQMGSQPPTISLTSAQREAARRLQEAKQTIPHFYLSLSANAEGMVAARAKADGRILWDAFFVRAIAKATAAFERMHYRFGGDHLIRIPGDAVGVAVDYNDNLYVVPVENPLTLTVEQISDHITAQIERIRQGDSAAKRLGSTYMTISNLGGAGIEVFTAVINPPEAAILAVGKIAPVVHVQDGQMMIQRRVNLTLSVDHRVISGKYASAFLNQLVHEIEAF